MVEIQNYLLIEEFEKRNKLRAKMEVNQEKIKNEKKLVANEISVLKKIDDNDFNPELYLEDDNIDNDNNLNDFEDYEDDN